MTDRKALRSMLIYARREAEVLELRGVADLLSQAVEGLEAAVAQSEALLCADASPDHEFYGHFASRRLQ